MPVKNRFAEMHDEITGWRHHLHANPELMFDVHETAEFVVERLREFGITDITTGIGQTGVVATIKGNTDKSGKVIGLRADMDALPIQEATGLDYASKVPGKMHACGHDGHTAMLLGAAKYLAETRNFDGTVVLIFQPAEERGAGAREMCRDGLMDRWNVQEVYAMHNAPGRELGQFYIRSGPLLASADTFDITITGRGGHAASPHRTIDPNLAAAHVVVALQSIAARNVDPLGQLVVSVCAIHSDNEAHNVIPQSVALRGTVRTLDPALRDLAEDRLKQITQATSQAYGCTAAIDYSRDLPVTVNTKENTRIAADTAEIVAGKVERDTPPVMGGEDFSYMLEERPGAFIFLGAGEGAGLHHPEYKFNDDVIPVGCSWFAEMIERRMPAA